MLRSEEIMNERIVTFHLASTHFPSLVSPKRYENDGLILIPIG